MNRNQLNRTQMYNTVVNYLTQRRAQWEGIPAVSEAVTDLSEHVSAITDKLGRQESPTTAATDGQEQFRSTVAFAILEMANRLCAFAFKAKDMDLVGSCDINLSMLVRMSGQTLESTGKRILGLVTTHAASLEAFGINSVQVNEFEALLQKLSQAKTASREAIVERMLETVTFPQLLQDTSRLLRQRLDKLMTQFRSTDPEFYAGYVAARVIVSRRGGSTKTTATAGNGTPPVTPPATPAQPVASTPQS